MALFTKESLESLKQRIDLVEVISGHVDMKRSGSAYVGLCPFHDEKTPSFNIQRGDSHYHCFGCGAHGDAISFMMEQMKVTFTQAVEQLAERFNVPLQRIETKEDETGFRRTELKQALEDATQLYHYCLLHTEEGQEAMRYLYRRGIDEAFIRHFRLGWAPSQPGFTKKILNKKGIKDDLLIACGLAAQRSGGGIRDFFSERINFPLCDNSGATIGFSARKIRESTFGGKYINSTETTLFKKSRVLFGLNHCRRRIIKEKHAIIVEGQLDALRLIHNGLNIAVAALGTAFGDGHVKELNQLGISHVFIAFDSDPAGREAAVKVGQLFQKEGIDALIVNLPEGSDPDTYVLENGIAAFQELLPNSQAYLPFYFNQLTQNENLDSPAVKSHIVYEISQKVRSWSSDVMIHEGLKQLAHLAKVPEEMMGVGQKAPTSYLMRKSANSEAHQIDPALILEKTFLCWLIHGKKQRPRFFELAELNLTPETFKNTHCRQLYEALVSLNTTTPNWDLLSLLAHFDDPKMLQFIENLVEEGRQKEHEERHLYEVIKKILERHWMEKCEEIKIRINSGELKDEEAMTLLQELNTLKKNPPKLQEESIC